MQQTDTQPAAGPARKARPSWRLPEGVPPGLWDYAQSPLVADDYDEYFAFNSLFEFDEEVIRSRLAERVGVVADLGCGTGRALVALCKDGHRGLAVDLSLPMLRIVREKAQLDGLPIGCVRANMVTLDGVRTASVDHAVCLFSTLGMIRGRANRQQALAHARRIIRPGGRFVLHVHNYWFNLRDPGGPWWVLRNAGAAMSQQDIELGDRWFPYRGVPNMFLHVFRWPELRADLRSAGFRIEERIPLNVERRHRLRWPWLLGPLRTNGWIVVCS